MLKLYNTLTRKTDAFEPLRNKLVGLYACGPTVYWFAHIGNLRTYIFEDILKRVLEYNGYKVKHIMNITDVGHLTSDADTGDDKIESAARKEKKTAWEIAGFYENAFRDDLKRLNIKQPSLWTKATSYIQEQIDFIKVLEGKGFTYKIADGVYFDTSKIQDYGKLWGSKKRTLRAGARVGMVEGKKNISDFALWKFTAPGVKRQMEWSSPWGRGFPGWHTECVVMAERNLELPFDIHCGGIDHIPIHHTNEIAQSEAAFGKNLARFWLHGEFLTIDEDLPEGKPLASDEIKMAKSKGNIVTLESLIEKNFNPLAFRYLCLTTHYRSRLNFSWPALESAQSALQNLYQKLGEIQQSKIVAEKSSLTVLSYKKRFLESINDDLNTPEAIALMWELIKSPGVSSYEKHELLLDFDEVFALSLDKIKKTTVPPEVKVLVRKRELCRLQQKWEEADKIREEIKKMGWLVEDASQGPEIKRITYE